MSYVVLNYTPDTPLRRIRYHVLVNAGFSVVSVDSDATAAQLLELRYCDAIILCATASATEQDRLARLAKQNGIAVLLIYTFAPPPPEKLSADAVLGRFEDPGVLVSTLASVLQGRAGTGTQSQRAS
jgi:hypothetical protein